MSKMKNLEMLDVQEMNIVEMKEQNGGGGWFERVANCALKDIKKIVERIVTTPPDGTSGPRRG